MAKNILVILTYQNSLAKKLSDLKFPELEIIVPKNPEEAHAEVAKATILFANPTIAKKYINETKKVLWVQSTFAGIDSLNEPNLRKDYILTNVRDVYGEAMAEYVFSYILFFEREIQENLDQQKRAIWRQRDIKVLKNKTICILGTGSIGKDIAKLAKAFNMRTLGYHQNEDKKPEHFDEIFTKSNFENCLSRADYVISVLPKTKDTDNIINTETLSYMKSTAIFMNIGRGNAVNEEDLIKAIREKRIAKAVLDVFKQEPLPKESPLWSIENIYITPHLSGYMTSDKMVDIFTENYKRFISGKELLYKIDFTKGY